jgi:hypothetical protein
MSEKLFTEKNGRIICLMLVVIDIFLGGSAVFLPYFYSQLIHPDLNNPPIDFIMRTGVLWLVFAFFQLMAVISKKPRKWFLVVAAVRLMDVPADIIYGITAIGATLFSRLMIFSAPVINTIFGIYLYKLYNLLEKENLKA